MSDAARQVAETLRAYPACLICTHVNPEGDAIGAMLALAMALEQHGVQVTCYDRDGVPEICRFLPTWERVVRELPAETPPLVVFVDADRLERCGVDPAQVAGARAIVRIDHHTGGSDGLTTALVDTSAAATGEIMAELLPLLDTRMTPEIATCLHAAIMVDTGRFSYTNTTPRTHRIAAELVAAGADVPTIVEWTWGRARYGALRLLGCALNRLQVTADGRIAWSMLRDEDFCAVAANAEDTEGIIDHIRSTRDSELAALFSEKRGVVRVSLRSSGHVDVAAIARSFGGGGHVKAAGLTYPGDMEQAVCHVLEAMRQALNQA